MSDIKKENVFNQTIDTGYSEAVPEIDFNEFDKVIKSRRSIRIFNDEKLDEQIIEKALEHALLAPNSSNLQSWKFIWVRSDDKLKELAKLCFNQNGARTASDLIVCIADTTTWKKHCQQNLQIMKSSGKEVPKVVREYYEKIAPMAYGLIGPFGVLSPFKWLLMNGLGLFQVMAREPIWPSDLKVWAAKTTALACENLMLSLRAQGADSLPMEGFDSKRVKKMLKLKRGEYPIMVIAAGKRSDKGVYGPQLRFPKEQFIHRL